MPFQQQQKMSEETGARRKVMDNGPAEEEGRHTERLASSRSRDTERKISFPEAGFSSSSTSDEQQHKEEKKIPEPPQQQQQELRDEAVGGDEVGPVAAAVRNKKKKTRKTLRACPWTRFAELHCASIDKAALDRGV